MEVGPASEYSESSYSASGFARHCMPPRRPGPKPETLGPAARCLGLATNGMKIKKILQGISARRADLAFRAPLW